jgi:hypothetical protein
MPADVSQLLGDRDNYGSYQVYATLTVRMDGISIGTNYRRSLDFESGLHATSYMANDGNNYTLPNAPPIDISNQTNDIYTTQNQ